MINREKIRLKIRKLLIKLLRKKKNKRLVDDDFTIISNNCWGGQVYESLNLPKKTPTVGLFFMPNEYLLFLEKFPDILNEKLVFINSADSKYCSILQKHSNFGNYPIALLGDVEIEFLHYKSEKEAEEKWNRRVKRINFEKLIFKMNDQNECSEEQLKRFASLPYKNKIIFSVHNYDIRGLIYVKKKSQKCIMASEEPIISKKYFDVINYINSV